MERSRLPDLPLAEEDHELAADSFSALRAKGIRGSNTDFLMPGDITTMRLLNWPIRARRIAASLYFLALNWLMLAPAKTFEEVPEFFPHEDKLVHGGVFLALAFLVRWALAANDRRVRGWQWVLAALLLYAGSIEALQPLIGGAGRQFEWLDMACNVAGAGSGWLLYGLVRKYHARVSRSQ